MKCELLNEIATLVSIITDLYAAPDPRYTTGFERAPLSRRAVAAALPAHLSSLPAFLPVLSGPTASRRYTGSDSLQAWISMVFIGGVRRGQTHYSSARASVGEI
jgi:hypothetical protein